MKYPPYLLGYLAKRYSSCDMSSRETLAAGPNLGYQHAGLDLLSPGLFWAKGWQTFLRKPAARRRWRNLTACAVSSRPIWQLDHDNSPRASAWCFPGAVPAAPTKPARSWLFRMPKFPRTSSPRRR